MGEGERMSMAKYRVGLVGVNRGSGLAHQFTVFPETEIVALCDLDDARLADAGRFFGVDDGRLYTDYDAFVASDVNVVVIGTPIQMHAAQAVKALDAGKHVLSEVTAAWTVDECAQIVETVKRTGLTYMMAENTCYYHFIRQWHEWTAAGRLGDIFYAEAEYIHELHDMIRNDSTGQRFWRAERPPIYYCSHSLGPLLMLMDDRVVQATGSHSGYNILPESLGPGALSMEVALFKTAKGATIKLLRSSVAYREPAMHFYSLYGTRGFIENGREGGWAGTTGKLYLHGEPGYEHGFQPIDCPTTDPAAPPEALLGGHGSAEFYLIRDFMAALETGARPPIDVIRAMDFTVPGIVAHEAALTGQWLNVPQFGW